MRRERLGLCDLGFGFGGEFGRLILWPRIPVSRKRRLRQAETRSTIVLRQTEGQESGVAETILQACHRGAPLPSHEVADLRWLP
jgi:hypothetical protein